MKNNAVFAAVETIEVPTVAFGEDLPGILIDMAFEASKRGIYSLYL